jgi:uncharacterized protein YjeT (DUF2065 family)
VDFLPDDAVNIPCCHALTLTVLAVGLFLILHGITYILFTSQFKVAFPKIFDILVAGLLGFFGGFLILSFAALIILLTPFGTFAGMNDASVQYNMSSAYWLFDGIHSIVSQPNDELTTEMVIKQLLIDSQPTNLERNSQQAEPDESIKPDNP